MYSAREGHYGVIKAGGAIAPYVAQSVDAHTARYPILTPGMGLGWTLAIPPSA